MVFSRLFRRQADADEQLSKGLEKSRRGVFSEIARLFDRGSFDDDFYDELEMLLIQGTSAGTLASNWSVSCVRP